MATDERALQTEQVVFRCSPDFLAVIDRASETSFASRADYIRGALVERLRREGVISAAKQGLENAA